MNTLIYRKTEYLVIVAAFILSLVATLFFLSHDMINANGDSIARLNIARRVIDNTSPGLSQIGYVWLPFGSMLMLPFIWIDWMYYSGFAGAIISMGAFVASSYFVFKIGEALLNKSAGLVAFILFALNPNVLYMQSTPLSETQYVAFLLGGVYFLIRWARDHKDRYLMLSGAFFLGSTLLRYDGWAMSLSAMVVIGVHLYLTESHWRRLEATLFLFGTIAFLGPMLWVYWNFSIFDDPLYFIRGEYSATFQQADLLSSGLLPSYRDAGNAIGHTFFAGQLVSGWLLIVLGLAAIGYMVYESFAKRRIRYLFIAIFLFQALYYVFNLYMGSGVIFVPQLVPNEMHNIRYAITFLPLFVIAVGVYAARVRWAGVLIVAFVLAEYVFTALSGNVILINESIDGFSGRSAHETRKEAGEWLKKYYDGGTLLVDVFDNDSIVFHSRIPSKRWITVGDPELYGNALKKPSDDVSWIVIRDNDHLSDRFSGGEYLKENYVNVYRNSDIAIFKAQKREIAGTLDFPRDSQ